APRCNGRIAQASPISSRLLKIANVLRDKISILLLLLAATSPLLAMNPCQLECLAFNPPMADGLHGGQHSGMHAHARHAPPAGARLSTPNCGSHVAVAQLAQAYVLAGPERSRPSATQVAALEPADAAPARSCCSESLPVFEPSPVVPAVALS